MNRKTVIIIIAIAIVQSCCCIAGLGVAWQYKDQIIGAVGNAPTSAALLPTPLPATPKPGIWQGETDGVYFSVSNDNKLNNFSWSIKPKGYNACPIRSNEKDAPIPGGIFEIKAEKKAGGIAWDFIVVFRTETTAELSYTYDMCPSTLSISFNSKGDVQVFTGTATAHWVKP
jgi:hypothetical protein